MQRLYKPFRVVEDYTCRSLHFPWTMSAAANKDLRMSYSIGRGEEGVMTFEPYKSTLLPLWRFRNVEVATKSAEALWERFLDYDDRDDFVGMDMARKYIQMGMTRTKRYANHKGGRKYNKEGNMLPMSEGHEKKEEMENASRIFQKHLDWVKRHRGYGAKKQAFMEEKREWKKEQARVERKERQAKTVRRWKIAGLEKEKDDQTGEKLETDFMGSRWRRSMAVEPSKD